MSKSTNYGRAQTVLLCLFAVVFFLDHSARLITSPGSSIAGAVLCVLGLVLMFAAFMSLRAVVQIAPEPKQGGHLVTSGLYRWLRHPIYTGILLLLAGLFLRKPTAPIAIAAAAAIGFLLVKAGLEEQLLLERYPEYAHYKTHSWGIIPGLR
jgi:protein-S-isoprenylcysteine O-methyltransferase Ste14